jgi:hypothetical protein
MSHNSLRIFCLDGGGMKGYTSLLILKRIIRTMAVEGSLQSEPKPCEGFDLIVGTSTGGLIAVMPGRLGMTVDECLREFEVTGKTVFDKKSSTSNLANFSRASTGLHSMTLELSRVELGMFCEPENWMPIWLFSKTILKPFAIPGFRAGQKII